MTDFFLSTAGEYGPLSAPRACRSVNRLRDNALNDHMLIEIDPAFADDRFGLSGGIVRHLLISSKFQGQTLFPISEWPAPVNVTRIVDVAVFDSLAFTREQVEPIAWVTLFRSIDDAWSHAKRMGIAEVAL